MKENEIVEGKYYYQLSYSELGERKRYLNGVGWESREEAEEEFGKILRDTIKKENRGITNLRTDWQLIKTDGKRVYVMENLNIWERPNPQTMTREEAMNDDFQVPNGFLPSDRKQSTMTQKQQGGIARREKALEILNKNIGAEVLGTFGETDTQWIIDAMIEFSESPLPASPEGMEDVKAWIETEAEKQETYPRKHSGDRSAFDTIMMYEVNDHRYECFEKGAWAVYDKYVRPLQSQLAEAREALDRFKQSLKDNEGMEYE